LKRQVREPIDVQQLTDTLQQKCGPESAN